MNIVDFLKVVGEIRNNCGLDCTGPNYYVFIHKGLNRATVNNTGYINMADVEYIIVACAYRWNNCGYINSSLTQLVMVDANFNPVNEIPFGDWDMKELGFTCNYGQWYNKYKPYPHLELRSDPSINNYKAMPREERERFPEWEWKCSSIKEFGTLLTELNEFAKANVIRE